MGFRLRGRPVRHLKDVPSQLPECSLTARKNNHLLVACLPVKRIEHLLDTIIVGMDERLVEDDRFGSSIAGEQPCKGQPREDRQLLAHAAAEPLHVLFESLA